MLTARFEKLILKYLSGLNTGKRIKNLKDLEQLSARELLLLAKDIDDRMLGLFIQLLKSSRQGRSIFDKLMGDHEEANRDLVDSFFNRYMKMIIPDESELKYYNPLSVYLPPETFDDLAFVQSRQQYFLRQTIDTINEYLHDMFHEDRSFKAGEQDKAWSYFWEKISSVES
jgi:hypothetical protein